MEFVVGDLLDSGSLATAMQGCELVFHVAATSEYWRAGKETVYRVNVEGTRHVMEAALEAGVERVVHTSSVAALGYPSPGKLIDEAQAFPPKLVALRT